MNLAVNAKDAMPQGGRLHIETGNLTVDASSSPSPEVENGDYVRLRVKDSGSGMTDDVKSQIFEPFFTTKALGAGTGLGLAMVYGAVKQANGHIFVDSVVGEGTSFRLLFPAVRETSRVPESPAASPIAPGRGLHILVVDDERPLRKLIARILTNAGYDVRVAASGAEALTILDDPEIPLDLLISDVVMPHTSGKQLAEHALEARNRPPRILFMSGYSDEILAVTEGAAPDHDGFLGKPFTPEVLLRAVGTRLESN